jgi:hypothetical protein
MADLGAAFRDAVVKYINDWGEDLEILKEVNVGARFIGTPRRIDLVIRNKNNNRYIGIECKVQFTDGTAYEKLSYALDDCISAPIPAIIAFAGPKIRDDMKSKLLMSGYGIELLYEEDDKGDRVLKDTYNLFRQRCYIELGLNWFPCATGQRIREQLTALGYNE